MVIALDTIRARASSEWVANPISLYLYNLRASKGLIVKCCLYNKRTLFEFESPPQFTSIRHINETHRRRRPPINCVGVTRQVRRWLAITVIAKK